MEALDPGGLIPPPPASVLSIHSQIFYLKLRKTLTKLLSFHCAEFQIVGQNFSVGSRRVFLVLTYLLMKLQGGEVIALAGWWPGESRSGAKKEKTRFEICELKTFGQ